MARIKTIYWKSLQTKKYWKEWEKLAEVGDSFVFDLEKRNTELDNFSKDVVGFVKELYRNYQMEHVYDDSCLERFIARLRNNKEVI